MSTICAEIARSWIGTPYVDQASIKGVGTDCLGLVRGVWRERYGQEPEPVPHYTNDWGEVGGQEPLFDAALRHMTLCPTELAGEGDVLLFRMREGSVAKHLGVLVGPFPTPRFVHAYSGHGVVESPLTLPWRRRVAAVFRFP